MRNKLRLLAGFVFVLSFFAWIATGANRGWTKTSEPVKILDEVTGIEGITYQKRLAPGLDFLGAGLLAAGILTGLSFLFCKTSNQTKTQP